MIQCTIIMTVLILFYFHTILVEYMENVVLDLDEQLVRCYWYMFEFECVIAWYTMRHDTIAIAHSLAIQLQRRCHMDGFDMILIEYMERYVLRLLRKNRKYVGINWCIIEYEGVNACCEV